MTLSQFLLLRIERPTTTLSTVDPENTIAVHRRSLGAKLTKGFTNDEPSAKRIEFFIVMVTCANKNLVFNQVGEIGQENSIYE